MNTPLLKRLDNHIAMMAPHQREREGGKLLMEARDALKEAMTLLAEAEPIMAAIARSTRGQEILGEVNRP